MTGVGDVIFIESVEIPTRCNLVTEFIIPKFQFPPSLDNSRSPPEAANTVWSS
jgi:hypothetical protein